MRAFSFGQLMNSARALALSRILPEIASAARGLGLAITSATSSLSLSGAFGSRVSPLSATCLRSARAPPACTGISVATKS
jgi:hypothetical protein